MISHRSVVENRPSPQDLAQTWDETVDVVVVGSGFAGLAAAIEAKTAGASVALLEKMKGPGGNSIISDGGIAAGLDHRPIKGFYAVGKVTGGVHGACRLGSCSVTDCLVFGHIAGRNGAAEKP